MAEDGPAPNATIYVRNLDEKIKIPALIESLSEIFGEFGDIIQVIAKKSLKRKGQAFVVYSSVEEAAEALESLQGFDLFDRPMEIAYARSRSDAIVEREDGEDGLEAHKRQRLAEKERKQAAAAAEAAARPAKRPAVDSAERPLKANKSGAGLPDEFLPPNKILILRDFPDEYGKPELEAMFRRYPGLKEIRTVPGRAGLAFAEYEDDVQATTAKEAVHGVTMGEKTIRVTFQKQ